eukprot:gene15208-16982_t
MICCLLTTLVVLLLLFDNVGAEKAIIRVLGTGSSGTTKVDGTDATSAQVKNIVAVWVDTDGTIYSVDYDNNVVQKVVSEKYYVAGGTFTASVASTGGDYDKVPLNGPRGIAGDKDYIYVSDTMEYPNTVYVDSNGKVYILDNGTRIRTVVGGIINAFAGDGTSNPDAEGAGRIDLAISSAADIKGDSAGNIYYVEVNSRKIRMIGTDDRVTTFMSSTGSPYSLWIDIINNTQYVGEQGQVEKVYEAQNLQVKPSSQPTSAPSMQPTAQPSRQPTSAPTPSFRPTTTPTLASSVLSEDTVHVKGQARVNSVNGDTLNELSITTLTAALRNISGSAQSSTIISTVLVSANGNNSTTN